MHKNDYILASCFLQKRSGCKSCMYGEVCL